MNLFLDNGHLSDEGLRALLDGSLDEMQNLEAAEHLSFCDECLVRYTTLLEGGELETPETDLVLPVMQRIRRRAAALFFNRYAAAAAAVVLAVGLWASGAFQALVPRPNPDYRPSDSGLASFLNDFSGALDGALDNLSAGISGAFQPKGQSTDKGE